MIAAASAVLLALAVSLTPGPVAAEQLWSVGSGRVIFNFNVPLLKDLGIDLKVAGTPLPDQDDLLIGDPRWAFPIRPGSDFKFRAEYGAALPGGSVGGTLGLNAEIVLSDRKTGAHSDMNDLEIVQLAGPISEATTGEDGPPIVLRSHATKKVFCELVSSMFDFRVKDREIRVHYLNARVTKEWATSFGRPDLAGWVIGMGEIRGETRLLSSTPPARAPYTPHFTGGFKDVSLGALSSCQQAGHIGTIPTGTTGLTMSTTSCNLGDVDVPWLAPMQTDHPMIHMALYRELNGRLEQIGVSWLKHGFFALSNNQCSTCQHHSDGSYLGVGCSDTYGVSNNQDRNYLGPREEVNPYTGIWNCVGSHFAGGPANQDCTRRHGSSGHNAVEHRLVVQDADLATPGAEYYYEAYYIVRGDEKKHNNWGWRECTMTQSSSTAWTFTTPSANNPLVEGPMIESWGDMQTTVDVATDDGQAILAVKTTDLGGGMWHYEYALLNMDSDRQLRAFDLSVAGVSTVTNIGFHDNDTESDNDWAISMDHGMLHWSTKTFEEDPNGEALEFGYMVNFWFDADAPPANVYGSLGLWKPGADMDVRAKTMGPINAVAGVGDRGNVESSRIVGIHPNPTSRLVTIAFEAPNTGPVKLEICDAAGRVVRTVVNEGHWTGAKIAAWDGRTASGTSAPAGVYYARLQTAASTVAKPIVMVK